MQVKLIKDAIAEVPDGVHGPRKPSRVSLRLYVLHCLHQCYVHTAIMACPALSQLHMHSHHWLACRLLNRNQCCVHTAKWSGVIYTICMYTARSVWPVLCSTALMLPARNFTTLICTSAACTSPAV